MDGRKERMKGRKWGMEKEKEEWKEVRKQASNK